jgi:hypothetical protein
MLKLFNVIVALVLLFEFEWNLYRNHPFGAVTCILFALYFAIETNDGKPTLYEQLCEYLSR